MFAQNDLVLSVREVIRFSRGQVEYPTEKRPFHVLSRRLYGKSELYKDGDTFKVDERSLLYLPSEIRYSQRCLCDEEVIAVHFDILNFDSERIRVADCPGKPITDAFIRLHALWNEKRPGYRYRACALLYEILAEVGENTPERSADYATILPSLDSIDRNLAEPIAIPTLAALCGVSESGYRRIFGRCMGVSPLKYINRRRVELAKSLVLSRRCSMSEIAQKCGFSEPKYLYDVFKRETGTGPLEYRKNTEG